MSQSDRGYPDNHNHFVMAGDIDAMIAAAERAELSEIVFSEHNFHLDEAREAIPYLAARWTPEGPPLPIARYVETVREAGERAKVGVLLGLEMDVRPEDPAFERASDAFTATRDDWDVVLGSVHTLSDDVSVQDEGITMSPDDAWEDYLGRVMVAARSGRFDIISHPIRLGFSVPGIPEAVPELLAQVATIAAESGVALELNGSDLRRRPDLIEVLVDVLARHDAPISLGSDAHLPHSVGYVRAVVPMLRARGVTRIARIRQRTLELVPLPA
ncbi:MAG TPA: PHP domain-containing protein [Gaiellales bacterium]|jgi:histidinol-phosphatase (PHP family)